MCISLKSLEIVQAVLEKKIGKIHQMNVLSINNHRACNRVRSASEEIWDIQWFKVKYGIYFTSENDI